MLALSSLSKSSRFVGIMYAGAHLLHARRSSASLRLVTGSTRVVVDVARATTSTQVGDVIFRLPPRYDTPVARVACSLLVALIAASVVWCSNGACRGVEVVT